MNILLLGEERKNNYLDGSLEILHKLDEPNFFKTANPRLWVMIVYYKCLYYFDQGKDEEFLQLSEKISRKLAKENWKGLASDILKKKLFIAEKDETKSLECLKTQLQLMFIKQTLPHSAI